MNKTDTKKLVTTKPTLGKQKKKRTSRTAIVLLLLLFQIIQPMSIAAAKAPPSVNASAYVVMDANTGEILFEEHGSKKVYPASATKLVTAMVVIDSLPLDKKIKLKKSILDSVPNSATKVGLKSNSIYSVDQLLHMLLIASGADAANSLAVAACGSQSQFIKEMNQKVEELGCQKTNFDNVIGLDIGDGYKKIYTTAKDFAAITRYAMSYPEIRKIVAKKNYQIPASKNSPTVKIKSTNQFYSTKKYSDDLYTIIGSKTGTTNAAGYVLMATARDHNGNEVICSFFGNKSMTSTYTDIRKLLDYAFTTMEDGNPILTAGCYDLWYRDSLKTIAKYLENGLLPISKDGAFLPKNPVKESDFADLLKKTSYKEVSAAADNPNLTARRALAMIMDSENSDLNGELAEKILTLCCDNGILPEKYRQNPDQTMTKEEMVLLLDYCLTESE